MVPQIIVEVVFCNRWKAIIYNKLSSKVPAYTLSFWAFKCSSMMNNFSSENMIRTGVQTPYRWRNAFGLSNLALRCCVVRPWTLRRLNGVCPRSSVRIIWIVERELPIWGIALFCERQGFRRTQTCTTLIRPGVRTLRRRPVPFRLSTQRVWLSNLVVRSMSILLNPSFFKRWKILVGEKFYA